MFGSISFTIIFWKIFRKICNNSLLNVLLNLPVNLSCPRLVFLEGSDCWFYLLFSNQSGLDFLFLQYSVLIGWLHIFSNWFIFSRWFYLLDIIVHNSCSFVTYIHRCLIFNEKFSIYLFWVWHVAISSFIIYLTEYYPINSLHMIYIMHIYNLCSDAYKYIILQGKLNL